jgi:hypothetical protein
MMRWVINSQKLSDFRVDLNLVGASTVVFTRWIPKRTQKATPGSYGVSYERNETVQATGCESARWGGHYRVLSYVGVCLYSITIRRELMRRIELWRFADGSELQGQRAPLRLGR